MLWWRSRKVYRNRICSRTRTASECECGGRVHECTAAAARMQCNVCSVHAFASGEPIDTSTPTTSSIVVVIGVNAVDRFCALLAGWSSFDMTMVVRTRRTDGAHSADRASKCSTAMDCDGGGGEREQAKIGVSSAHARCRMALQFYCISPERSLSPLLFLHRFHSSLVNSSRSEQTIADFTIQCNSTITRTHNDIGRVNMQKWIFQLHIDGL